METYAESLVDPAVSRAKFNDQITQYQSAEDEYIRRGWWMVKAEFPEVFIVFGTPSIAPPVVAFGALINFDNYDLRPPSVWLVDPFTRERYTMAQVPIAPMPRRRNIPLEGLEQFGPAVPQQVQVDHLLQGDAETLPFICVPGIREYHNHPAHTGDSWLLHRNRGEGTLYFILNLLGTYGVGAIKGYQWVMQARLQPPTQIDEIPE